MAITRKYDVIFGPLKGPIPLAYMRALAWGESRLNPDDVHKRSGATGLLQVTRVVLESYNKRHSKNYTLDDMRDPTLNVTVAVETLKHILIAYGKQPGLEPNWDNQDWVALFTLGWNAGYSKKRGLLKVAREVRENGRKITLSSIALTAKEMGKRVVPYLSMPKRVAWAYGVSKKFSGEKKKDGLVLADILSRRTTDDDMLAEADILARRTVKPRKHEHSRRRVPIPSPRVQVSGAGFPTWILLATGIAGVYVYSKGRRR